MENRFKIYDKVFVVHLKDNKYEVLKTVVNRVGMYVCNKHIVESIYFKAINERHVELEQRYKIKKGQRYIIIDKEYPSIYAFNSKEDSERYCALLNLNYNNKKDINKKYHKEVNNNGDKDE